MTARWIIPMLSAAALAGCQHSPPPKMEKARVLQVGSAGGNKLREAMTQYQTRTEKFQDGADKFDARAERPADLNRRLLKDNAKLNDLSQREKRVTVPEPKTGEMDRRILAEQKSLERLKQPASAPADGQSP